MARNSVITLVLVFLGLLTSVARAPAQINEEPIKAVSKEILIRCLRDFFESDVGKAYFDAGSQKGPSLPEVKIIPDGAGWNCNISYQRKLAFYPGPSEHGLVGRYVFEDDSGIDLTIAIVFKGRARLGRGLLISKEPRMTIYAAMSTRHGIRNEIKRLDSIIQKNVYLLNSVLPQGVEKDLKPADGIILREN